MPADRGPFDLSGRIALVTGGNGGIGLGIARGLGAAGAHVVLAARQVTKGDAARNALADEGIGASFLQADLRSATACAALADQVLTEHSRIDILVNNAGLNVRKLPEDLADSEWEAVLDTNLSGAFRCSRAVFPAMRDQGRGKIINIGSMYSLFGAPKVAAYGASKGGLVQLTRSLAAAWAVHNIQVNAILPGWIDTELTEAARAEVDGLNETVLARTPAARWGRPDDLAGTAVFLGSQASDFVTGTSIAVDGGYSARG